MKALIVTNRNIKRNGTGEKLFGERPNSKGPGEIRLAWASRKDGEWQVELVKENTIRSDADVPSRGVFLELRQILNESGRNCVFYIHGFNKSFVESLEQAEEIQEIYGEQVVMFSWPANPGGFITSEYRQARAIARASGVALDRTFEKMARYLHEERDGHCRVSFNLLMHSLGNYLFEFFVRSPIFTGETRIFDNIVLQQADVDHKRHRDWVDLLRFSRRQYITLNESDRVLNASDLINSDRLGNTSRKLNARRAVYVDFTGADRVGKAHRLYSAAADNANAQAFFARALSGQRAEVGQGIVFNNDKNRFEVE